MAAEPTLTPEEKCRLITRELQEVVGEEDLLALLKERDITIYWGTAPTGKPHLGYFVPMMKIADFLKAGCKVIILLADLHAFLDNMKSTWELLEHRTKYYEFSIKEILKTSNVPLEKLHFVRGTSYQLDAKYTLDVYRMAALTTVKDAQHAGAEVVKQDKNPKLSSTMYPILQALDEVHLGVDAQFGGADQRKIFMFARDFLPKIDYKKRIHLMNFLVPGLGKGGKMSASDPNSKIDFTDSDDDIRNKIRKAFSVDGQKENNGLLAILRFILFHKLEREGRPLVVDRPEQYGGRLTFNTYQEVENAFVDKSLGSVDLKSAVAEELIKLLTPLREAVRGAKELMDKAYPVEEGAGHHAPAAAAATPAAAPAAAKSEGAKQ